MFLYYRVRSGDYYAYFNDIEKFKIKGSLPEFDVFKKVFTISTKEPKASLLFKLITNCCVNTYGRSDLNKRNLRYTVSFFKNSARYWEYGIDESILYCLDRMIDANKEYNFENLTAFE